MSEIVKRDLVAEIREKQENLRNLGAELRAEMAACEAHIKELAAALEQLGDMAQPKRGRPRGKKAEPKGE